MRNLFFLNLILNFCITGISQSSNFTSTNQQWIQYYNQFKLSNKWSIGSDAGLRWKDNCSEIAQFIIRANASYQIGTRLKVGIGYVQSGLYNNSVLSSLEYRPYEEISFDLKKEKFDISNRIRVEQRFINQFPTDNNLSTNFLLRGRFNFSYGHYLMSPFKKFTDTQLWIIIGDELFFNVSGSKSFTWFDQNRLFAGPLLKMNSNLSLQFLYSAQVSRISNSINYRLTNVFWLSLKHKINCVKEKNN